MSRPVSLRAGAVSGSAPITRTRSARPAASSVIAQRTASVPEVSPLHSIKLGPVRPNLMATEEASTLLDALGRSMGLAADAVSAAMVSTVRQTVSRLP